MRTQTSFLIAGWAIAFIVALSLDVPIARHVHTSGLGHFVEMNWWAQKVIKRPGEFPCTVAVAVMLLLFKQINPKQLIFILLSGVISGANSIVKWIVGRSRPYKLPGTTDLRPFEFHPFWNGLKGLIRQKDLCFPSGHGCTAGALAAAIYIVWPKGRWIFITLAVMVGIERIIENAHYTSDVVAAAGFAMLGTALLYRALGSWLSPPSQAGFEVLISGISSK